MKNQKQTKTKSLYDLARNLNLDEVIIQMGGVLTEPHRHSPSHKYKLNGRTILIKQYAWIILGEDINGSGAIDLVCAISSIKPREALNLLLNINYSSLHATNVTPSEIKPEIAYIQSVIPEHDENTWNHVREWLIKTRKLNESHVDQLHAEGLIQSDEKKNAVFIGRAGGDAGCEIKGTGTVKFAGKRGGSGIFELAEINLELTVAVVESAIDAISLRELGHNGRIISSGGAISQRVIDYCKSLNMPVIAAFDNDAAGDNFSARLIEDIPGSIRIRPTDNMKDWNDVLVAQATKYESPACGK